MQSAIEDLVSGKNLSFSLEHLLETFVHGVFALDLLVTIAFNIESDGKSHYRNSGCEPCFNASGLRGYSLVPKITSPPTSPRWDMAIKRNQ